MLISELITYEARTTSLPEGLMDIAPTPLSTRIDSDVVKVPSLPSPILEVMAFGLMKSSGGW